jgi:Protein of unknown function (DUF2937)
LGRIVRTAAVAFGLFGGVVASQGPEFAQQYRQRIGGAIDELRTVVERFETDAHAAGETTEGAIARLRGNPDDLASRQGAAMQGNRERLARLEQHRQAMIEAGPFSRVGLMVRNGDTDVMSAAYRDFEPAVPVTEEGILSAVAGFAIAWGAVLVVGGFTRSVIRRRPGRGPAPV